MLAVLSFIVYPVSVMYDLFKIFSPLKKILKFVKQVNKTALKINKGIGSFYE